MPRVEMTDDQVKASILHRLYRRGRWGAAYMPTDTLVNWMSRQVRDDGLRVKRMIRRLRRVGHVRLSKKGETISLNSRHRDEIISFIERHLWAS